MELLSLPSLHLLYPLLYVLRGLLSGCHRVKAGRLIGPVATLLEPHSNSQPFTLAATYRQFRVSNSERERERENPADTNSEPGDPGNRTFNLLVVKYIHIYLSMCM